MTLSTRAIALGAAGLSAITLGAIGFARGGGHPAAGAPPAVYGTDPAAPSDEPLVQTSVTPSRRVSVSFSDAPVRQVLDWLRKQDANFVVASSSVPSDLRLTLNVKDEPLSAVEKVIANAMGGSWTTRDGILVFHKGLGGDSPFAVLGGDGDMLKAFPGGGQFFASPDGKTFEFKVKDLDKIGDQFGPEWQKKIEKEFGPDFQKKIQDQFGPEWQKKIEKEFGPDFQKKIQDQFGPDFQKKMKEQAKEWEKQGRLFGDGKGNQFLRFGNQDLDGLMASLSSDQKDLMKRQGYLKPSDLTDKQRKMLGDVSGKFEMNVKTDKGEMTIKSG